MLAAQPQLGRTEQTVDDEIRRPHPVVDQLHIAFGPDHEQRRQLALAAVRRELDVNLVAVVERPQRPPCRRIATDNVAEPQLAKRESLVYTRTRLVPPLPQPL